MYPKILLNPEDPSEDGVIRDLKDGRLYRTLHLDSDGQHFKPRLSLLLSYDDANIHTSVSFNVSPIAWTLAELPAQLRQTNSSVMFSGLWIGRDKPGKNLDIFWDYGFDRCFNGIVNNKVDLELDGGTTRTFSIEVFGFVADKPALRDSLNHVRQNGFYGCIKCHHPAKSNKRGSGNNRIYDSKRYDEKTDWNDLADKASNLGKRQDGINGHCILQNYISLPRQAFMDPLHHLYLGVFFKLMTEIMDNMRKKELKAFYEKVNKAQGAIKFPSDMRRKSTDFSIFGKWKASELKNFLLHVIPILKGKIGNQKFLTLVLLSQFVTTINKFSITDDDIERTRRIGRILFKRIERVFGEEICTINNHEIVHIWRQLRDIGSQTFVSTSVFEDSIRFIKTVTHGTTHQREQIVDGYVLSKAYHRKISKKTGGMMASDFISQKPLKKQKFCIIEGHKLFNRTKDCTEDNEYIADLLEEENLLDEDKTFIKFYKYESKILKSVIHSKEYVCKKNSCNYFITFGDSELDEIKFADILFFASNKNKTIVRAILKTYPTIEENVIDDILGDNLTKQEEELYEEGMFSSHISTILSSHQYVIVTLDKIIFRAIRVKVSINKSYAIPIMSGRECN